MAGLIQSLVGPAYQAIPKWNWEIEKCPQRFEEHQCVGKFVIYAYLSVLEEVQITTPSPSGGRPSIRFNVREHKILPFKFEETFKVDFKDTIGANDEVEHCWWVQERPALNPVTVGANKFSYGSTSIDANPPNDDGVIIHSTSKFSWFQGTPLAGGGGGGQTTPIPVIGSVGANVGLQFTAGPPHNLDAHWTLSSKITCAFMSTDGEIVTDGVIPGRDVLICSNKCYAELSPQPNTRLSDAKNVYRNKYIPPT